MLLVRCVLRVRSNFIVYPSVVYGCQVADRLSEKLCSPDRLMVAVLCESSVAVSGHRVVIGWWGSLFSLSDAQLSPLLWIVVHVVTDGLHRTSLLVMDLCQPHSLSQFGRLHFSRSNLESTPHTISTPLSDLELIRRSQKNISPGEIFARVLQFS